MLKDWNKPEQPGEEELEERLQAARAKLSVQQMQIKEHKLPVLVLCDKNIFQTCNLPANRYNQCHIAG